MKIKHLAIRVNDLEESIKFYEFVTKLTVRHREKGDQFEICVFNNGEVIRDRTDLYVTRQR